MTLHKLIQLTYDNVYKYLETPSIVTAMAQKVNPGVNIDASIASVSLSFLLSILRSKECLVLGKEVCWSLYVLSNMTIQ
jgi:hypothetical protein